jgi:hypothetical protein
MLLDENAPERRMSEAHLPVDFPRFDPMPTQGIAPELVTVTSCNVVSYADYVRNQKEKSLSTDRKPESKGILDSEGWHRPYAEALMEAEPGQTSPTHRGRECNF